MINNTLFRPAAIRENRKKFNPDGFDLAAAIKARKERETAEKGFVVPIKKPGSGKNHLYAFNDAQPVELITPASQAESDLVIQAAYRQVFGNAHLMESEKLPDAESQLRSGQITVMEFVRQLAKSARYQALFFERCSNLRAIELNFKHLLGRAPESHGEISEHISILAAGGFEAEIDSYLDSDEYFQNFGTTIVPHYRGYKTQPGKNVAGFTHSFQLLRGASSSDKSTPGATSSQLQHGLLENKPTQINALSTVPASILAKSPLNVDYVDKDNTFQDLDCLPRYKSPEFLATRLSPDAWVKDYKAREAAATFPVARRSQAVKLANGASGEAVEIVIRAAYKQVFGNAHLMESQRLLVAESQLKEGRLTVKGFIRALATSELYRARFFDPCPNTRAVELNFKHLLGRAPDNAEEISEHVIRLVEAGFSADIESYLNSPEYAQNFGDDTVPYYVGYATQTGKNVAGYNRILQLNKDVCNSDRSTAISQRSQLQTSLLRETAPKRPVVFNPEGFNLARRLGLGKYREESRPPSITGPHLNAFAQLQPIELVSGDSTEKIALVIRAAYQQVFGNAHLMESERFPQLESQLYSGQITVMEFIRLLAKSDRYRALFFNDCPNLKTIELNFKHLLGRAPENSAEIAQHIQILVADGFDADIDTYLDSDEYLRTFGVNVVPYYRGYGTQVGKNIAGFTYSFDLLRGAASSDKSAGKLTGTPLDDALLSDRYTPIVGLTSASPPSKATAARTIGLSSRDATLAKIWGVGNYALASPPRFIAELHLNAFAQVQPIELMPGDSIETIDLIIQSAYKQVFGNVHLMESERLPQLESRLCDGQITVLEFIRLLAKSERYRALFFDNCPNLKTIELNFKHLLGRAPESYAEISQHIQILAEDGFEAEIDAYLDSDEYFQTFGFNGVPYYRGYRTQPGKPIAGYTYSFDVLRGAASSDKPVGDRVGTALDDALLSDRHHKITGLTSVSTPNR